MTAAHPFGPTMDTLSSKLICGGCVPCCIRREGARLLLNHVHGPGNMLRWVSVLDFECS